MDKTQIGFTRSELQLLVFVLHYWIIDQPAESMIGERKLSRKFRAALAKSESGAK